MAVIDVRDLTKTFRSPVRGEGWRAGVRALLHPEMREIEALQGVSFSVGEGEVVGLLGPNGAGKTVTLKCIAGLLHPTSGTVTILGHVPHRREPGFLKRLTMIAGHRAQLVWDLPVRDTFRMHQAIYELPDSVYQRNLDELVGLLELEPLLSTSVRRLSLGQRMRCELAVGLVHGPTVVLLDEPTLGLDVTAQSAIRGFLRRYNETRGASIVITSHYMADLAELTHRVVLIDQGRIAFEGSFDRLVRQAAPHRFLKLTLRSPISRSEAARIGEVERLDGPEIVYRVPREETARRAAQAFSLLDVVDLTIEEPEAGSVVEGLFAGGSARHGRTAG